jgi:hypothetical protein
MEARRSVASSRPPARAGAADHAEFDALGSWAHGQNWFFADHDDTINNGNGPGPNDRLTKV